jgi:hypothetical protein
MQVKLMTIKKKSEAGICYVPAVQEARTSWQRRHISYLFLKFWSLDPVAQEQASARHFCAITDQNVQPPAISNHE